MANAAKMDVFFFRGHVFGRILIGEFRRSNLGGIYFVIYFVGARLVALIFTIVSL